MKLSLGFSPCPNDTFIFDAMIHKKVDTEGLSFEVCYDDVETLNQKAFKTELDITKLSYHAYAYLTENYVLLHSGSALGYGVGPLLICKSEELAEMPLTELKQIINRLEVAIPGKYTTANFLLNMAFPEAQNKREMKFFEIEPALLDGKIDLGVIIHENRFTYQEKGLKKIMDLGEYWETQTHCPIPLGGIMIRRDLSDEVKQKVNRIIRRSVKFAFENPASGMQFICSHAQEMSEDVIKKHIELYVNNYSLDLGEEGRKAVEIFFQQAMKWGQIPQSKQNLFI